MYRQSLIRSRHRVKDEETKIELPPSSASRTRPREKVLQVEGQTIDLQHTPPTLLWQELRYHLDKGPVQRALLDGIEGWIKPGTLTALMVRIRSNVHKARSDRAKGSSGAGKTTLLNVLANRASTGVVSGVKLAGSRFQGSESFARSIGYAQQQDLHLASSTVREALQFSALLRQPQKYSAAEKIAYVEEVIHTLDMDEFADAIVGIPGEGKSFSHISLAISNHIRS